jgi:hypothetical protein
LKGDADDELEVILDRKGAVGARWRLLGAKVEE